LAQKLKFSRTLVYRFAQGLAGFEVGNALGRNGHGFTTAGVAPHAGCTVVDGKAAEATDFYAVPAHQRFAHGVQKCLDSVLSITVRELAEPGGQFFDKV